MPPSAMGHSSQALSPGVVTRPRGDGGIGSASCFPSTSTFTPAICTSIWRDRGLLSEFCEARRNRLEKPKRRLQPIVVSFGIGAVCAVSENSKCARHSLGNRRRCSVAASVRAAIDKLRTVFLTVSTMARSTR